MTGDAMETCSRPTCSRNRAKGKAGLCDTHWQITRHGYMPAGPVIAHYQALRERGLSRVRISELTGLDRATLTNLGGWTGECRVVAATADAILGIPLPSEIVDGGAWISATGTRRRLQALMLAGRTGAELGAHLGVSRQRVAKWLRQELVSASTATAVRDLCARLWMEPGTSALTAQRAAAKGWVPFLAWDDIDDPAAVPNLGGVVRVRAIDRVEDLRSVGLTRREIRQKLGDVQLDAADRSVSRAASRVAS